MNTNTKMYGFRLGELVRTTIALTDERDEPIAAGTLLRIVASAPKVRYTSRALISQQPERYDSREYFLNAVRADQEEDFGRRVRTHFVTVKHVGK